MEAVMGMMGAGSGWVFGVLAKATILLSVAWGLSLLLRRASASTRHMIWSAAVVGALGLPVAIAIVPWRLPVLPALPPTGQAAAAAWSPPETSAERTDGAPSEQATPSAAGVATEHGTPSAAGVSAEPGTRSTDGASSELGGSAHGWRPTGTALLSVLLAAWAIGLVLLLGRLVLGGWLVRRIVTRARPLDTPDWKRLFFEAADRLDLPRAPTLLMSDRVPMPFASGLARPVIVLPESARDWDERRRRMVLCHELAHVRRRDLLLNVLGRIACALYWFHPLVWVASRRLRAEAERAADDTVLRLGTRASEYAEHLLHIVCRAGGPPAPAIAVPMAQKKEFEGRMMAILEPDARRAAPTRTHALVLASVVLALVIPLAAMGPAPTRWETPASSEGKAFHNADASSQPRQGLERSQQSGSDVTVHKASSDRKLETSTTSTSSTVVSTESSNEESKQVSSNETSKQVSKENDRSAPRAESQQVDSTEARIVAALLHALDDSAPEVRDNAAYALGKREVVTAVPALSRRLVGDESGKVRETSAWALGEIESRDATSALTTSLKKDADTSVRATVVWALGQIEDPSSVPALTAALSDSAPEVRGRAAWALGTISPDRAPEPLVAALTDTCSDVRLKAAWALGQIEDPSVARALTPLLSDQVAEVRKAGLWALSRLDGDAAREALLKAMESKDPETRAAAVRALAGNGGHPWPWPWPDPRIR